MAVFQAKVFNNVGSDLFARAKKQAALAIKLNVDSSGSPTARGYQQAMSYLEPFLNSDSGTEAIDSQSLIAGYDNSLTKLSKKEKDQNDTVAAFKLQELDSYFTSADGDVGSFRNPASLIDATSQSLDSLLLGVINAIDTKTANGDSTDALYNYMNDLNKRANSMRDLSNKNQRGELTGQSLDGYGYYVDTNPLDGSVRRAALIPVGLAPEGITGGFRRIEATSNVGGALLPIYAPATQNALGEYTARIGDATWTGSDKGALQVSKATNSKPLFQEGGFNIADSAAYPVAKSQLDSGSFGKGYIGRDADGNPIEQTLYRGRDNKLYSVDQATIDGFRKDPLLSAKLDGYVPQFSPTEMQALSKEAVPFSSDRLARESRIAGFQSTADAAKAEADRMQNLGFFERLRGSKAGDATPAPAAPSSTSSSFFANKNTPNKPEQTAVSSSTPDLVEQGKSFFRKAGDFFAGRTSLK